MAILGESTITKLTVNTIDTQNYDTTNLGSNLKKILLESIYPVGSIYVYQRGTSVPDPCPIANTLGGTWERIEDEFLYSSSNINFYGKFGGSNKGYLLKHKHSARNEKYSSNTEDGGTHTHDFVVHKNDWHTSGTSNTSINTSVDVFDIDWEWGTNVPYNSSYRGDSSHPLIGNNGSHGHKFDIAANGLKIKTTDTTTDTGGDIIGSKVDTANMPKYFGVIAWKRTA